MPCKTQVFKSGKTHFDDEAATMRRELEEAIAELHQLRLVMFAGWTRSETDRLN
jgi:hypothetical protein